MRVRTARCRRLPRQSWDGLTSFLCPVFISTHGRTAGVKGISTETHLEQQCPADAASQETTGSSCSLKQFYVSGMRAWPGQNQGQRGLGAVEAFLASASALPMARQGYVMSQSFRNTTVCTDSHCTALRPSDHDVRQASKLG